jgi:hypothetical protein
MYIENGSIKWLGRGAARVAVFGLSALSLSLAGLIGLLLFWSYPGRPKPFLDAGGAPLPNSLSEKVFIDVNGTRQGIIVESKDTSNPVLLYLHGVMPDPGRRGSRRALALDPPARARQFSYHVDHYVLQQSINGGAFSAVTLPAPTAMLNLKPSPVNNSLPATTYRFQVQAVDIYGNMGAFSPTPTFTVPDTDNSFSSSYNGSWSGITLASAFGGSVH